MNLKYDNITISGGIAVGKNTLKDNLARHLEPEGWKVTSGGQLLREFTREFINPKASLADDAFHNALDNRTRDLLTSDQHYVIEAWLAGFIARELNNTLRVLLVCHNDALRIDRVANRDNITIDEAKRYIRDREEDNFSEWKRLYGDYNFWDPKYYHLVIDTYENGPQETMGKVLETLGFRIPPDTQNGSDSS